MAKLFRSMKFWATAIAALTVAAAFVIVATGCGSSSSGASTNTTSTSASSTPSGTLYIAVTGSDELSAGTGHMGYAVVDIASKKVTMVDVPGSDAPHGMAFGPNTNTLPNTNGRVTKDKPSSIYLGNAGNGTVMEIDLATQKVTKTIQPPAGAKLAICGMDKFTDGKIYMASMGDGKLYPLDPATDTIGSPTVGGGTTTTSICGVVWTNNGSTAYLSNMYDPNDKSVAGYLAKVDWPSGKLVKKITDLTKTNLQKTSTYQHQIVETPDGKFIYVTDGYDGNIVKVDTSTDQVVKTVSLRTSPTGTEEPHTMVISSDGKWGYIDVRHSPTANESSVFVYDLQKDQVVDRITGISAPLICGSVLEEN